MTIYDLMKVPVPERTNTYTPIAHKDLLGLVKKELEVKNMDFQFDFKQSSYGKMIIANFIVKKGNEDFSRMISVINSYNKKLRVGVASGTKTWACNNGALFGETVYLRKHTGNVDIELKQMIENQINQIDAKYYEALEWMDKLKLIPLNKKEMIKLADKIIEEKIMQPREYNRFIEEINYPTYDYGGYNLTVYEAYQHCTHALKTLRADLIQPTHNKLNTFINDFTRN